MKAILNDRLLVLSTVEQQKRELIFKLYV